MDNLTIKRNYLIASGILTVICTGGLLYFWQYPSALALGCFPLLGICAAALVWCLLTAFLFCKREKWLDKRFRRTLRYTLALPLWMMFTALFLLLPGETLTFLDETLTESIIILWLAIVMTVVPILFLINGIASICFGASHIKHTPNTETHLYREGPLVLACLFFIGEIAYLLWFLFYFVIQR